MGKLVTLIICFAALATQAMAQVRLSDAIAVVVHTNVITARDIDSRIMPAVELLYKQYADKPEELNKRAMELRREAIENLVDEELILQEFADSKLILPENYVEKEVDRKIREGYGDRLTLVKTLKAQGLSYEGFYQRTRDEVILQAMYGKYVNSVNLVSPQMILNYYKEHTKDFVIEDQVRMRVIMLVKTAENADAVRGIGKEILEQIRKGADFEEMVTVYSEDQVMKGRKDAHLEWRDRASMQPQLAEKAFAMKPGEVSDLIETDTAVWIIRLEDFRPTHVQDIEQVRGSIENIIRDQIQSSLKKDWINRLKKKYLVRYY